MANIRTNQQSFGGGELTPEFMGRISDAKFQTGLSVCRNFNVLPHGALQNRAGFAYVGETKNNGKTRLIPFSFSNDETFIIEMSNDSFVGYFRFYTQGAVVIDSVVPYFINHPYTANELFDVHFVQSNDVLTLVHPNHPPAELRRYGNTDWRYEVIDFGSLASGVVLSVLATAAPDQNNVKNYTYVATGVDSVTLTESLQCAPFTVSNNLLQTGAKNTISLPVRMNSSFTRYNIYLLYNGIYGYIGQTDGSDFVDDNIAPDLSKTPPVENDYFTGAGNYPSSVSYFEQRRVFGGTINKPQNIWLTKSGTESNLSSSLPSRDDDSISFRVAAREANSIKHLLPMASLVALTGSAEWKITSNNSDALTPSTISVRPQSYIGANNVQPMIINASAVYAAARGGHVRELAYNWQANGYLSGDLSLRAPHLFDGLNIVDMAYAKSPVPIVWMVSSNGNLLGMTYVPDQQIIAWHRHDTINGAFESVACVVEGDYDVLYAVVRRTIQGETVRYIERLDPRDFTLVQDAFFVDCGNTYSGTPTMVISGLWYLEGQTVSILADGSPHPQRVVTNGQVFLDNAYSKVSVGLPITADVKTVPAAFQVAGDGKGRVKNVNKVWLNVYRSSGISVGANESMLTKMKSTITAYGQPNALVTDEIEITLSPSWGGSGQVMVRQTDPLPLTLLSMSMEVSTGS
jgi:hypothetical protein